MYNLYSNANNIQKPKSTCTTILIFIIICLESIVLYLFNVY